MSVGLVMAWDQRGGLLAGAGKFIHSQQRSELAMYNFLTPGQQVTFEM